MICLRRFCITDDKEPTNSIFTERYYEHMLREIAGSTIDIVRDAILIEPKPSWQNLLRGRLAGSSSSNDTRTPEQVLQRFLFTVEVEGHEETIRGKFQGEELILVSSDSTGEDFIEEKVSGINDRPTDFEIELEMDDNEDEITVEQAVEAIKLKRQALLDVGVRDWREWEEWEWETI